MQRLSGRRIRGFLETQPGIWLEWSEQGVEEEAVKSQGNGGADGVGP